MPIVVQADTTHLDQHRFSTIAYGVMGQAFDVHQEMGRFFKEDIYRAAIARRIPGSQAEVQIDVRYEDFSRQYFIDLLVNGGAPFELKAVEALAGEHRSQMLNYLLLSGLSHGKLINMRTESVQHEFVNTSLQHTDCVAFEVCSTPWQDPAPGGRLLMRWFIDLLHDVGTGLDVRLYEAAAANFLGAVMEEVEILVAGQRVGTQKVCLASPEWGLALTTRGPTELARYEEHAKRFVMHTRLSGIHWINVTREMVTFTSIAE